MTRLRIAGGAIVLASMVGAAAGCGDVTPEKIERWKGTEKGPAKLREAVRSSSVTASLRAQALAGLIDIGEGAEAIADVKAMPEGERGPIVREAEPRLAQLLHASKPGQQTTRAMRQAKDALFELRAGAPDDAKAKIDDDLIGYTTVDFVARADEGEHPTAEVLSAVGQKTVPKLLELMQQGGQEQLLAAAILGRIDDPQARARAADLLVDSARKHASRERSVPDGLLQAVASVGGPHGNAFLIDQAEHGPETVREKALLALAQHGNVAGDQATLAGALRIGADRKLPGNLREPAFQIAEKVGPDATQPAVRLMSGADDLTMWRAAKTALVAGRDKAVGPVLEALPQGKSYKPEDFDDYVITDIKNVGQPALGPLKAELDSKSWVARAVAVRAIGQMTPTAGKADSIAALEKVASDTTRLKGFPGGATVGSEAKSAITALKTKK